MATQNKSKQASSNPMPEVDTSNMETAFNSYALMSPKQSNPDLSHIIVTATGGFYFTGREVPAPPGFIAIDRAAISGSFSGNKGIAGVAKGASGMKWTLDFFPPEAIITFNLAHVINVMPCLDMHASPHVERRG